jgi:hypothetical protein
MAALLARREREGVSLRRLAADTGIPIGTLSWWSWRLRKSSGEMDEDGNGFVEVTSVRTDAPVQVMVVLSDGTRIEVGTGFDAELLRSVVRALQPC